jgi:transposase
MRILGIDLAFTARHRAILADKRGRFLSPVVQFRTGQADLERVYAWARQGMAAEEPLAVVLEATDIVWYPVAVFFQQRGATVYLVNPRMAADLARFYQRYAKSDRLSAQTLFRR